MVDHLNCCGDTVAMTRIPIERALILQCGLPPMSNSLESSYCVEALEAALELGCPEIFNTDQGAQFTNRLFTGRLEQAGVSISMHGRGRALDNVFVERLWWSVGGRFHDSGLRYHGGRRGGGQGDGTNGGGLSQYLETTCATTMATAIRIHCGHFEAAVSPCDFRSGRVRGFSGAGSTSMTSDVTATS